MKKRYSVSSKVWLYPGGNAAWHFLTIPKKESAAIKKTFGAVMRGWGSLRVTAKIGDTSWNTSIFWDNGSGAYLLPLKAAVRKAEGLSEGESVRYAVEIHP